MSDAEARAFAAGDTVEVQGKQFKVVPLNMQQLHEIQRAAVKSYKREYLSTFAENLDLLPKDQAAGMMADKLEETAKWDISDLPVKMSYAVGSVPMNDKLVKLLRAEYGDLPDGETARRAVLATSLDSGAVSPTDVQKVTGTRPRRVRVPYDSWWVTASYDGMITLVWASVTKNHPKTTKEQIGGWPLAKLAEAARLVEHLTSPAVGNT